MEIYNLTCKDATNLGGPMGSEYTIYMWTKPFHSLKEAKAYAEKYCKNWLPHAEWEERYQNEWSIDSGAFIFIN